MDPLNIASLFAQNKIFPPETLTIAITGACNLHCAHCWVDAGPSSSAAWVATDNIQQIIEEFAALGGAAVRLTGGEPLLHPDWLELLRLVDRAGLQVMLQTNGMLFCADNLQALQDLKLAQLNIQISLDGATAATHDLVRGEGAFEQALQGVQRLVKYGFGQVVALFFTEMRHNLHELPDLLLLAERLGIGSVSSGSLVICGRASEDASIAPPDPEQYLPLLELYRRDAQFRQLYAKLGRIAALEWCAAESSQPGCSFIKNPYLTTTGVLYPCLLCHADDYSVSAVFEKGLSAALIEGAPLWSALQEISRQRIASIEACQSCTLLKSCAGGCMGRAWGSFGEFLVAEDRCHQRQTVLRWKEKS